MTIDRFDQLYELLPAPEGAEQSNRYLLPQGRPDAADHQSEILPNNRYGVLERDRNLSLAAKESINQSYLYWIA